MKFIYVFLLVLAIYCTVPQETYAHPGNTAADGCHYCRTNCDKWGVPWNERHCHNGGSVPAPIPQPPAPTINATPTPLPTSKPTATPKLSVVRTVKPSPSLRPSPSASVLPTAIPEPSVEATVAAATKTIPEMKSEVEEKAAKGFWGWLFSLFSN